MLCVNITYGRETELPAYVAELAYKHGLVCVDLQQDRLRPDVTGA